MSFVLLFVVPLAPDLPEFVPIEADPERSVASEWSPAKSSNYNKQLRKEWRRGSGSNRRIKVLQTSPLPLGYRALECRN